MSVKFSIITPSFNVAGRIEKTLASLLSQTYTDFEYLIMDGGSSDATVEILEEYAGKDRRIKYFVEKDNGIYDAMNKGIQKAEGEYSIFLGAGDTLYDKDVLQKAVNALEQTPADILYGYVIAKDGEEESPFKRSLGFVYTVKFFPVCHQAVIARTALLKERPFDTSFKITADQDWMMAMKHKRRKFVYIDEPIAYYPLDGVSSTKEGERLCVAEQKIIHKKYFPFRHWFVWKIRFIKAKLQGKEDWNGYPL